MKPSKQHQTNNFVLVQFANYQDDRLVELYNRHHFSTPNGIDDLFQEKRDKCELRESHDNSENSTIVEFYRDNNFVSCHEFIYDDYGNVSNQWFYQQNIDLELGIDFFYDKNHRKEQATFYRYGFNYSIFYEYDPKLHISKMASRTIHPRIEIGGGISNAEQLACTFSYKYDRDKLLEERCTGEHGQTAWTINYVYDRKNRLIEKNAYDRKGILFCKIALCYDENNRKTEAQRLVHKDYVREWAFGDNAAMLDFMM